MKTSMRIFLARSKRCRSNSKNQTLMVLHPGRRRTLGETFFESRYVQPKADVENELIYIYIYICLYVCTIGFITFEQQQLKEHTHPQFLPHPKSHPKHIGDANIMIVYEFYKSTFFETYIFPKVGIVFKCCGPHILTCLCFPMFGGSAGRLGPLNSKASYLNRPKSK